MPKKAKLIFGVWLLLIFLTGCQNGNIGKSVDNEFKYEDVPLDFVEITTNDEGNGWSWDTEKRILTLNGMEMHWSAEQNFAGAAIELPKDSTIVLAEGSVNIIDIFAGEGTSAIVCKEPTGNITFEGEGELIIKGLSQEGLESRSGTITINSGRISIQDDKNWAIKAGNELIINGGVIESEIGFVEARETIMVNGGDISLANYGDCIESEFKNEIILNGGNVALKWLSGYESDWADYTEKQMAIHTSDDKWIINDGHLLTTGIYTNGIFEVNGGTVTVSDAGVNIGIRGKFIQNDGKVNITSNCAGIGNWIYSAEDNAAENRIILKGGELDITCTDERYNAIELILEKKRNQQVIGTEIIIGDNMVINNGEWITENITEDSEIRQRDTLQNYAENQDYVMAALSGQQVKITDSN